MAQDDDVFEVKATIAFLVTKTGSVCVQPHFEQDTPLTIHALVRGTLEHVSDLFNRNGAVQPSHSGRVFH